MGDEEATANTLTGPHESICLDVLMLGTPRLPFDPPRRRSSLGFSKTMNSSPVQAGYESRAPHDTPAALRTPQRTGSNIGKKRTIATPFRRSQASPGHVAHVQRLFQSAKAELHADMQYAASPIGSIGSRLPFASQGDNWSPADPSSSNRPSSDTSKTWRYSTVPANLATTSFDVREPMPDELPPFSAPHQHSFELATPAHEPTSSGYVSPATGGGSDYTQELPPLPLSTPVSNDGSSDVASDLEQLMQDLEVSGGVGLCEGSDKVAADADIMAQKLKDQITVPQSALAAAGFALRRRRFDNNDASSERVSDDMATPMSTQGIPPEDRQARKTESPAFDRYCLRGGTPCPDPLAHSDIHTPHSTAAWSSYRSTPPMPSRALPTEYHVGMPGPRVTARGSPMPFSRPHAKKAFSTLPSSGAALARHVASSPDPRHHQPYPQPRLQSDWPYQAPARDRPYQDVNRTDEAYSWSPVATKSPYSITPIATAACGTSVVPEHNIRDSYRTDTLTPWLRPPNRFRKNGIGAEIQSQNRRRWPLNYAPGPTALDHTSAGFKECVPPSGGTRLFGNSPPRLVTAHGTRGTKRTRYRHAHAPDFDVAEDKPAGAVRFPNDDHGHTCQTNERDLVTGMYGESTSDQTQCSREGIRELSPNVNLWRKNVRGGPHSRKKRRPSYWDSDLREIKLSPAGRGGIESSPIMSNRSMMAEVENATDAGREVEVSQGCDSDGTRCDSPSGSKQVDEQQRLPDSASPARSM